MHNARGGVRGGQRGGRCVRGIPGVGKRICLFEYLFYSKFVLNIFLFFLHNCSVESYLDKNYC